MAIKRTSDDLHLLPLNPAREGFHHFICAWVYSRDNAVVLVDPGPRSRITVLLKALEEMNAGPVAVRDFHDERVRQVVSE